MSGPPPYGTGPRGWNPRGAPPNPTSPSPSSFMYRPPSPWAPVPPSPPPIISGLPRPSMQSPVPMSSTPYTPPHAMSPGPNQSLRGTRGTNVIPHPRPQWPQSSSGPNSSYQSTSTYESTKTYQSQTQSTSTTSTTSSQTFIPAKMPTKAPATPPSPYGGVSANGPRLFRPQAPILHHQNSYGGPTSSFQLSPTPSPIVCQTPNSEFTYSNRQTPMLQMYDTLHPRQLQAPLIKQQSSESKYDYSRGGIPLEPPIPPKTYVVYDEEEENGPTTAEIIANQSQDYVDEKLAEYQMTILQLQGKKNFIMFNSENLILTF